METLSSSFLFTQASPPSQQQSQTPIFMKSILLLNSNLKPKTLSSFSTNFKLLSCTATTTTTTQSPITTTTTNDDNTNIVSITAKPKKPRVSLSSKRDKFKVTVADAAVYKDKWLQSLSCYPLPLIHTDIGDPLDETDSGWVLGIDPDTSGALALLKPDDDDNTCSAQVFDLPYLRMLVGKNLRKRLDAKSIVQLIRSLDAPIGTVAYIEQSTPFPKDGKLGWWSGGFNYGLWIGILVSSGFTVIPVPSVTWKNEFKLSGNNCTKDDNRRLASVLFPSLDSQLKRKKDHGRAEALLIAAYGKGLKLPPQCQSISANSNTLVMDS